MQLTLERSAGDSVVAYAAMLAAEPAERWLLMRARTQEEETLATLPSTDSCRDTAHDAMVRMLIRFCGNFIYIFISR